MSDMQDQLHAAFERIHDMVEKARLEAADEIAKHVKEVAEDVWPRKESPYGDHPYAKNDSVRKWQIDKDDGTTSANRTVRNYSPHAIYTQDGSTRKGPETARSYSERGSQKYTDQIIKKAMPGIESILAKTIKRWVR